MYIIAFLPSVVAHKLVLNAAVSECVVVSDDTFWSKKSAKPGKPHVFAFHKAQRTWVNVHDLFRGGGTLIYVWWYIHARYQIKWIIIFWNRESGMSDNALTGLLKR